MTDRRRAMLKRLADEPTEEWDVEWVGTSGLMPEDCGFSKTTNGDFTIAQGVNFIEISIASVTGYVFYSPTNFPTSISNAEFECEIEFIQLVSTADGGTRLQIARDKGQLYVNRNAINPRTGDSIPINLNQRYKIRLVCDGKSKIYLDGEEVSNINEGYTSYNSQTRFFAHQGVGQVKLYAIRYREVD